MLGSRSMAALAALAVTTAGCGGNVVLDGAGGGGTGGAGTGGAGAGGAGTGGGALAGVWRGGSGGPPTVFGETLTLDTGGTATAVDTFEVVGDGAVWCAGALDIQATWTSTSSTIAFSGETCAGQVTCPNGEIISCGPSETTPQTCTYTLSNGDDTLLLTCPLAMEPIVFTRQP
jgi:hypothetical protein